MLHVFVCEDNVIQNKKITKCIENYITIENLDMKVVLSTHDPMAVIEFLKNNSAVGLYFLDVNLGSDINGVQLAEIIRRYDPRGFIVFITSHDEAMFLSFQLKVEAMDFIIKDQIEGVRDKVTECIRNAYLKYTTNVLSQKSYTVKVLDQLITVEYSKILYFETSTSTNHKVILHAVDRTLDFYGTLNEIEKTLNNQFFRCHKSYLVNVKQIEEVDLSTKTVYMRHGARCFASYRHIHALSRFVTQQNSALRG